jgi:hypothetical protein
VQGCVQSPKAGRDPDRHARAVRVSADNRNYQVIGLGEHRVERDRPRELVVRRAHSAVPRLHLLGRGLRMAWTNSALPNCTTRTYLAAA